MAAFTIMAKRRKTELEQERMTDANLVKVIKLLEPSDKAQKPISKKEACQILGMTYNTTRLGDIIQEFKQKQQRISENRAKLKGKPLSSQEICNIIEEYLLGNSMESISSSTFRSIHIIKQVLETNSVPLRKPGQTYFNPELIPEHCVKQRFLVEETVWSAKYLSLAKIYAEQLTDKYGYIYCMWLLSDRQKQYCWQPWYELASLEHLKQLGVKL